MEKLYIELFDIVKASINKSKIEINESPDWDMLLKIVWYGKIAGVVAKEIGNLNDKVKLDDVRYEALKKQVITRGMNQMLSTKKLGEVLKKAYDRNLNPIVFKGIVLAELYPEPYMRFSSDSDIYIDEAELNKMEKLLIDMDFEFCEELSKNHVPVYIDKSGSLKIELHDRLWEDYEGKQIEIMESLNLVSQDRLIKQKILGIDLVTMSPKEHLIFQVFHMAKHLALEGLPFRYLTDIYLFTERYAKEIDWKQFWESMKLLKYDVFVANLFQICYQFLDMKADVNIPKNINVKVTEELIDDIMKYGIAKEKVDESYATSGFVAQYFMRDHKYSDNKRTRVRSLLFPTIGELKKKYRYAEKLPILLPLAWGHRFISAFRYMMICHRKGYSAFNVIKKAGNRISLIADLKIVD